jgi:hypothetical protein
MREVPPMPNQANSKSQYKRLSTLGADVAPPPDWMRQEALTLPGDWPNHPRAAEIVQMMREYARMAVLAERERLCVLIPDLAYDLGIKYANGHPTDWNELAAAIRGKSEGE